MHNHYLASRTWKAGPRCLSPRVRYSICWSRHSSSLHRKQLDNKSLWWGSSGHPNINSDSSVCV